MLPSVPHAPTAAASPMQLGARTSTATSTNAASPPMRCLPRPAVRHKALGPLPSLGALPYAISPTPAPPLAMYGGLGGTTQAGSQRRADPRTSMTRLGIAEWDQIAAGTFGELTFSGGCLCDVCDTQAGGKKTRKSTPSPITASPQFTRERSRRHAPASRHKATRSPPLHTPLTPLSARTPQSTPRTLTRTPAPLSCSSMFPLS